MRAAALLEAELVTVTAEWNRAKVEVRLLDAMT